MQPIDDFFMLLETRTNEQLQHVHNHYQVVVISVILLALFTISFAAYSFFILRRRIFKPLAKLDTGAEHIAQGDYAHRIDIGFKDEIGIVASTFNAMSRNIQEHTRRLREKQERFQQLLEAAPVVFLVIDTKGQILLANHMSENILGYNPGRYPLQPVLAG